MECLVATQKVAIIMCPLSLKAIIKQFVKMQYCGSSELKSLQ